MIAEGTELAVAPDMDLKVFQKLELKVSLLSLRTDEAATLIDPVKRRCTRAARSPTRNPSP